MNNYESLGIFRNERNTLVISISPQGANMNRLTGVINMNHTGIFKDLNYMTYEEERADLKTWVQSVIYNSQPYKPIKLEFMEYVTRGMKIFLQSPFNENQ